MAFTGRIQANVLFARYSGISEDRVQNVFHFQADSCTSDDAAAALAGAYVSEFFATNAPAPGNGQVSEGLAQCISRGANSAQVVCYAQEVADYGSPLGSPIYNTAFTPGAVAAGTDQAAEVCAVLSYHGILTNIPETAPNPTPPPAVIRPASRRRGRLYIGPLAEVACASNVNTSYELWVTTTLTLDMQGAAERLAAYGAGAGGTLNWAVWSPTDLTTYPVVGGFIDVAPDVQRRRGFSGAPRLTWTP